MRGTAGEYPLDRATVRRLGAALVRAHVGRAVSDSAADGSHFDHAGTSAAFKLLIGSDTRESGSWIAAELAHGASGEGAVVTSAGIVPTPAIAYLTRTSGYDAGVVISASHNPFEDNGIKVFSGRGEKFTERVEREVEAIVADTAWTARDGEPAHVPHEDLIGAYLDHLRAVLPEHRELQGFKMAIDCANGATTTVAPQLFTSLGFELVVIGDQPDGRNINLHCGSTHPEALAETVVTERCGLGVAFDGDGDRAIFVDELGNVVNGDAVLLMCARQLKRERRLKGNAVVATVMSNIGLDLGLRKIGVDLVRCPVGDKYVMEEMLARGLALGGEQSGHVIFADYLFTGDGLCTALNVLRTLALTGSSLSDLAGELVSYPQVLLNVRVREKVDLSTVPAVSSAIAAVETRVAGEGRVLVRYSGTEPLLRVMIEGKDEREITQWAQGIVEVVRKHLG